MSTRTASRRKNGWFDSDEDLIQQAKTARSPEELARLYVYAEDQGDNALTAAVRKRVKQLGLKPSDFANINPARLALPNRKKNAFASADKAALNDLKRYGSTIASYTIPGLWEFQTLAGAFKNPSPKGKKNPASEAVAVYEEFHGEVPREVVTVEKKVHFHKHLAAAGTLEELVIIRKVDGGITTLSRFKGALLAFNEDKNQLFIEGGDQLIDLSTFGIDPKKAHEMETLGRAKSIVYHADKKHLGDEGGPADYEHGFRMTNKFGKHVIVKIARYPDVMYSVPSEQLLFSGGSYTIRAEGIDQ